MAKFSKRSLQSLKNVHPYLVHTLMEAIKDTPVDFTITDGSRTTKEQQELFAKGRTSEGNIVTNADGVRNKSNHQEKEDGFGYAVDLYPYVNGGIDINDKGNNLPKIATHIKNTAKRLGYRVEWGGDWKSIIDKPHFELK